MAYGSILVISIETIIKTLSSINYESRHGEGVGSGAFFNAGGLEY